MTVYVDSERNHYRQTESVVTIVTKISLRR